MAGEPAPAVEIRLIRPDAQVFALLSLFDGTPWPHPAAALADWKRAATPGERRSLGKPLEALIAALNPLMAQELAILDGSRIMLDLDPEGVFRWAVIVPRDDGTITALATAMVLTDGRREGPEGPFEVDRIGPDGSPLIASALPGDPVILGSDRPALASAIARLDEGQGPDPGRNPGCLVRIAPTALDGSGSLLARRVAAAVAGLGYPTVEGRASLDGEALVVRIEGPGVPPAASIGWGTIDPSWLDLVPIDRASVALAVAVGPGGDSWGDLLAVADRIERADPGRADVVGLRQRLALLGLARGIGFEADLWPNLAGVSAWLAFDHDGAPDLGLIALHAIDERAASRIADRVVPRVVEAIGDLGLSIGGRTPQTARLGASVLIGWGDGAIGATRAAARDPSRSAGPTLRSGRAGAADPGLPCRIVAAWPARLPGIAPEIREALDGSPPLLWIGWSEGEAPRDLVRWDGLRGAIHRFLDRLPAEPIPGEEDRP